MSRKKPGARYDCGKLRPQREEWIPYHPRDLEITRERDGKGPITSVRCKDSSALDRLFLRGRIDKYEHMAGGKLTGLWRWYRRVYACLPSPYPKVAALEVGIFGQSADESSDPNAAREYAKACEIVGHEAWAPTVSLCIYDYDPAETQISMIAKGLKALAQHFGLR